MNSMFGGRVFKTCCIEGVRGPSVGMRNVIMNSLWLWSNCLANSTCGIKWLSPGEGTIAMHVFLFIMCIEVEISDYRRENLWDEYLIC